MPSFRDIVYGIYGAWRLARMDRSAIAYFDQTVEGFWKSFFAAVIVAPGYALIILLELAQVGPSAGALRILLVELCAYTALWTAFPVAIHHVCEAIGKRDAFIGYIVAFNWAKVLQIAALLMVMGVVATGVLPDAAAWFLRWAVLFLILAYEWFITRTALGLKPMGAAGLVALDLFIELIVRDITFGMIR